MLPDINKLQNDLEDNTRLFLDILDSIPPDKLQKTNQQVRWSILLVAEHLLMKEQQVLETLKGRTAPVSGREADSKLDEIETSFLDFTLRLDIERPDAPRYSNQDIGSFSRSFRANRAAIAAAMAQGNVTDECLHYEHPDFGYLTKIEWTYYLIWHTEKHLHQINRIEASLENMPP